MLETSPQLNCFYQCQKFQKQLCSTLYNRGGQVKTFSISWGKKLFLAQLVFCKGKRRVEGCTIWSFKESLWVQWNITKIMCVNITVVATCWLNIFGYGGKIIWGNTRCSFASVMRLTVRNTWLSILYVGPQDLSTFFAIISNKPASEAF